MKQYNKQKIRTPYITTKINAKNEKPYEQTQATVLCKGTFLELFWNFEVKILSADALVKSSKYVTQQKKTAYSQQIWKCVAKVCAQ